MGLLCHARTPVLRVSGDWVWVGVGAPGVRVCGLGLWREKSVKMAVFAGDKKLLACGMCGYQGTCGSGKCRHHGQCGYQCKMIGAYNSAKAKVPGVGC